MGVTDECLLSPTLLGWHRWMFLVVPLAVVTHT